MGATVLAALAEASPARAAEFVVDRTDDLAPTSPTECTPAPDDCSLRQAIVRANVLQSDAVDVVRVPAGAYALTIPKVEAEEEPSPLSDRAGDLDIRGRVTIVGAGAGSTVVSGGPGLDDRIFDSDIGGTSTARATILDLTVAGGAAEHGGGIRNTGNLTLRGVAVEGNAADRGGIHSAGGRLTILDSVVSDNAARFEGGGVRGAVLEAGSSFTGARSTVSGNTSGGSGGGISSNEGSRATTFVLEDSTVSGNEADGVGGGVSVNTNAQDARATIRNSTVSGNTTDTEGGGVRTFGSGPTAIEYATITNNAAPVGKGGGVLAVATALRGF